MFRKLPTRPALHSPNTLNDQKWRCFVSYIMIHFGKRNSLIFNHAWATHGGERNCPFWPDLFTAILVRNLFKQQLCSIRRALFTPCKISAFFNFNTSLTCCMNTILHSQIYNSAQLIKRYIKRLTSKTQRCEKQR